MSTQSAEAIAYRVDRHDTVVWLGDSWQRFATANGWQTPETVIGKSIWESVSGRETTLIWQEAQQNFAIKSVQ